MFRSLFSSVLLFVKTPVERMYLFGKFWHRPVYARLYKYVPDR